LKIEFVGGISETRLYFALRRSFLVRGVCSRDQRERRKFRAIPPCSLLHWILVWSAVLLVSSRHSADQLDSGLISSATRKQPPLCWSLTLELVGTRPQWILIALCIEINLCVYFPFGYCWLGSKRCSFPTFFLSESHVSNTLAILKLCRGERYIS